MSLLVLGLVLFLGCHSVRIFAENWRAATRVRLGEKMYMGMYSVTSIVGFVLIVYGFDVVRWNSPQLWAPPVFMRHIASVLMLVSMVLLVAAHVPHNAIKDRLHHPMVLSAKVWALAHLLANGRLADVILFGAFLIWAVLNFRAARQRDRLMTDALQEVPDAAGVASPSTMRVLVIGALVWAVMLLGGHAWLFGVSPVGLGFTGL